MWKITCIVIFLLEMKTNPVDFPWLLKPSVSVFGASEFVWTSALWPWVEISHCVPWSWPDTCKGPEFLVHEATTVVSPSDDEHLAGNDLDTCWLLDPRQEGVFALQDGEQEWKMGWVGSPGQWASGLTVHQYHLGRWFKSKFPSPVPEHRFQKVGLGWDAWFWSQRSRLNTWSNTQRSGPGPSELCGWQ